MSKRKYDLCVKVGEYTNREGERKNEYLNIGVVLQGDDGHFILLKRTFNPAGVPDPDGRGTVMVSMFEPKQQTAPPASQPQNTPPPASPDPDDDIPF